MSIFEMFVFGWLAMALIRITIISATILNCVDEIKTEYFDYRRIILVILLVLIVIVIWPRDLYKEKLRFFRFPNKNMELTFLAYKELLRKHNEN
jgi:hypothetical protein